MSGESARAPDDAAAVASLAASVRARVRHDWLDALKGIGILAVVAGHIWTRGAVRDAIYTFHMPLFFMATGAVARAVPARILVPRMAQGLGLPFLTFGLLLLGLDLLIEGQRGVRPIFPDLWSGIAAILFATESLRGPFGIFWFVPCLFVARLIWNALLMRGAAPGGLAMAVAMTFAAALAMAADRWGGRSPLGLLPVPAALLMIWAGALWRNWKPGRLATVALTLLALAALVRFPPLNLRAGDIGWPLAGLAGAFAVTDRLAWLTRRLPLKIMRRLAWIGRNSLVVMFAHLAFVHYLWPYAPKSLLFIAGVAGPLLIGALARRNPVTRLFVLGERSEMR